MKKTKSFAIPKQQVVQAWELVKANAGSAGIDQQTIDNFEMDLKNNLYKLWNRMSSGSYFPPPVKSVSIPKKSGGERILGIPTVTDRVAQTVVALTLEPLVEPHFVTDSYGYRPNKSALDAVGITRTRCWQYDWVVEFDIQKLFDTIPRNLLIKAVQKHTQCAWVLLYIERWLTAPIQLTDGSKTVRVAGLSQGGAISPVLSNLFLHYVFDKWMQIHYPTMPYCRYVDDGIIHCKTEQQAKQMLEIIAKRFAECGLQLHPDKTRIVYCKDNNRRQQYPDISFDFLGYTFQGRTAKSNKNQLFISFSPEVSNKAKKAMRDKTRQYKWHLRSDLSLEEIAKQFNPVLQGWINYYTRYRKSGFSTVGKHFNTVLIKWAMRKYGKLATSFVRAAHYIEQTAKKRTYLFAHWRLGVKSVFT